MPTSNLETLPGQESELKLQEINIRARREMDIGPMPGLSLTKEEIPGNVQSITGEQIKNARSISLADLMNSQLQSVNVNDYQGNPFQMDVTYRGFTASPQIGTPQGLSVFLDGIRVNEPFGDVVNWDMIPMNALAGMDLFPGSNPIFGLNTLGGALAMRTKNGFDDAGVTADVLTGAFGRKQFLLSAGGSKGDVAGFVALNLFDENGWRQDSASKVNQIFGKLSYRNERLSLDGSVLYASNNLNGNGLIPMEMYQQSASSVFTSADKTKNELLQFQIASAFQVSDTFSITGQIYNRRSDRKAITGDINRDFEDYDGVATRKAAAGENPVCAFSSTNQYGIPDYYVVSEAFGDGSGAGISAVALGLANGVYTNIAGAIAAGDINPSTLNQTLPAELTEWLAAARSIESNMFHGVGGYQPGQLYSKTSGSGTEYTSDAVDGLGSAAQVYFPETTTGSTWATLVNGGYSYTDPNDEFVRHFLVFKEPINGTCGTDSVNSATAQMKDGQIQVLDSNGNTIPRNGANASVTGGQSKTGYADGTPTSVISNTDINQLVKGGAIQFNWNLDKHKFMVGTSLDHANSTYANSQMLGLLDANRKAYLDPDNIGSEFTAARYPINNNDFTGLSDTKSVYFSETFSPQKNLHFSFAARYNYTKVTTVMSTRRGTSSISLMDYQANYMDYLLCTGLGLDSCDSYLLTNPLEDTRVLGYDAFTNGAERESFRYHKLNPSTGVTWSPNDNLNLYANWSQGTRTPSAIELGCAFDSTLVDVDWRGLGIPGGPRPRSLVNGTSCTLPTTLSGDPYLPQVVSRTFEVGARGSIPGQLNLKWNASVYRSNLFDDIYFVGYTATQSFFDTIGRTRRQGLELGLSGSYGKADFKINYSLTDATFQSQFQMANQDNSSVNHIVGLPNYDMQTVNPGNRMPGIPLHNLNANFGYQLTSDWRVNLTFIAHGESFARGNENNEHTPTTITYTRTVDGQQVTTTKRYTQSGKTPGYGVLNFSTTYNFGKGWSGTLLINNLLDKEYYSASRLGINPFSPSINGTVGASGWNYNSNDWNSTSFVAPGAPRAAWVSIRYDFDADGR
ncbi:TonB-dependent receptor [Methylovorus glucosotrophus]|uniref:TonB-dependent receptor n=1 Tax=Methylovorus glucosotrophus TaxID=266009 RepID=UPI001FD203F2|nr:TonB-dependent receptor [Methylovorus glucosotrophus]